MALKEIEIHVTKFYLLSWIFGIAGLTFLWKDYDIAAGFSFLLCWSYSVADYQNPPGANNDVNTDDDDIKPA
jgi:hypothetical protein